MEEWQNGGMVEWWNGPMKNGRMSAPSAPSASSAQFRLFGTGATPPRPLPILDRRQRGTTFEALPVKAVLNSPASTGMGFWSLNPYVGCEFGCTYCYARDAHRWVVERAEGQGISGFRDSGIGGLDGREESIPESPNPGIPEFERRIFIKPEAATVLRRTLDASKLAGATLVIGTATDPYQPAERRFRLTRSLLEALLGWRRLSIGLITKSPLIVRDLDLLQRLAQRHELSVNLSLASVDPKIIRRLELRSPLPATRLRALRRLTEGGIHAGLLIAPVLPGITDSRASLAAVMAAAREAGAHYVAAAPLRLAATARARFLPHLEREFPQLAARYFRHYHGRTNPRRDYARALAARVRALQREYGFPTDEMRRYRRGAEKVEMPKEPEGLLQNGAMSEWRNGAIKNGEASP
jgi:DNA repair photolyase